MKSDYSVDGDPSAKLTKVTAAQSAIEQKISALREKRRASVAAGDHLAILALDNEIATLGKSADAYREIVTALKAEIAAQELAARKRQERADVAAVKQRVQAWAAAEIKAYENVAALARDKAAADRAYGEISRDYPSPLPQLDLSVIRIVLDRVFRDGFTRPGVRLTDLPIIIGDLDYQIQEAADASIRRLEATLAADDDEHEAVA